MTLIIALFGGCSAPHLEIAGSAKPRTTYAGGAMKLTERTADNVEVSISTRSEPINPSQPAILSLGLANFGTTTFTFDPSDVRILAGGNPLHIHTAAEARTMAAAKTLAAPLLRPATLAPLHFYRAEILFKTPATNRAKPIEVQVKAGTETVSFPLILQP